MKQLSLFDDDRITSTEVIALTVQSLKIGEQYDRKRSYSASENLSKRYNSTTFVAIKSNE